MPVDTTFVDGITHVPAAWLNPVNRFVNDAQSGASSSVGAALIPYKGAFTGSVATSVQAINDSAINVFAAMTAAQIADVKARTLTLDVTTACQAALNTGKSVFFPDGSYKITAALVPVGGQAIYGESTNGTRIVQYTAGSNGFTIDTVANTQIRQLSLYCNPTSTAKGIYVKGSNPTYITDVYVTAFLYGVQGDATNNLFLTRLYCVNNLLDGVDLEQCIDVYIDTLYSAGNTNGSAGCGLALSGTCSGVYIQGAQLALNDVNFKTRYLQPANVAGIPSQVWVTNMICDSAVVHGIYMEQGNTYIFTGCWSSNQGTGKNWYIGPAVTDVQLVGAKTFNNKGHGLEIQGAHVLVNGGSFQDAGYSAANTYDNIFITGSSANGTLITGARCYSDSNTARYGIRVTSGALATKVSNCDLRGNVTGQYFDDAGASKYNRIDKITGVGASIADTATATLFTVPAGPGTYMVTAYQDGAANGGIRAIGLLQVGTGSMGVSVIANVGGITFAVSGFNLQLTNTTGGALVPYWTYASV